MVLRYPGFKFRFYSNGGSPREPVHVRAEKDEEEGKFWIKPGARVAYNDGYDARLLREVLAIAELERDRIERAWNEFFG